MELIKAIEKLHKLESDVNKLDEWYASLNFNKPVTGYAWIKLKKSIEESTGLLAEEADYLRNEIEKITDGIEIEFHNNPYKG